ncbi:hypothetical protein GJ744_011467 [Endocarpon pusillum]|uniref:Fumarylacetoacetase n=1 Tax=Endocarpon pusillum TaxID=364733 RepID=A0A8H7E3G9_9EURO|nr:hypothetical protein GJ744_011467 [Endocarpon pusillum]
MASQSWFPIPKSSHFSLANIPFGIISTATNEVPRAGVAIGDHALDLAAFSAQNGFSSVSSIQKDLTVFAHHTLNPFAALGRPVHRQVRRFVQDLLRIDTPFPEILKNNKQLQAECLIPLNEVKMHLPMQIGDYTDFFVGKNHAYNCGVMFRGPDNALQPNYTHLPVGYHGRASSIVVSGTPIHRPKGQILANPNAEPKVPTFSPSKRLDFELELGAFVCRENKMGEPIPISEAGDSIFGLVLMNDWSARDIQMWESAPLGPFNAKNFGTSISPWVVLMDALEPFRTLSIQNDTELLPYLREEKNNVFDIRLEVDLAPESGPATTILHSNGKNLLFSFSQMLTHHSVGGCPMRVGDLLGSGTISGTEDGSQGCLLERSKNGKDIIKLSGGLDRTFLEDGDTVTLRGVCGTEEDGLVGFGQCIGRVLPTMSS